MSTAPTSMFEALFATSPDAMIVVDADGHIVLANAQAGRLFGYSLEAMQGLEVEALVPAELHARHVKHRTHYAAEPRVRPMGSGQELSGQRADGSQFPVEIALSPIEAGNGRFFAASIRDISETQRARRALARARYDALVARIGRLLLESGNGDAGTDIPRLLVEATGFVAIAIVFANSHGVGVRLNAASGMNPALDEVLAALLATAVFPRIAGTRMVITLEDLAGADAQRVQEALARAGCSHFALAPMFDRGMPMGAVIAFGSDVAPLNPDRAHVLQSVANLLASHTQRARSEEQLAHAQRLDAIGQLTGGVAHDFNNLLTVISGNLQLLESELADRPQTSELLDSASRAVMRGAELTRKLLTVARRQRLNPQRISPRTLLAELTPMLARTLGETIRISVESETDLPDVLVDPGELDTAILNLAINARDAMPRGGKLTIGAQRRTVGAGTVIVDLAAGEYVVLSVSDTGLGMSPEVLERAFEPFFTTKSAGRGSGLGLSMVYGFAKQSGGHLAADSRLGYGTRMELYLPAIRSKDAEAVAEPAEAVPAPSGGEAILVVEDEPEVLAIAVAFLKSLGYRTYAAPDAEQALKMLYEHADIALLFSDVILGSGMDGVELAAAVAEARPHLPTLLTSGYEHPALRAGSALTQPVLRKPYRREELAEAVRRALAPRP